MMRCDDLSALIDLFLDGELDEIDCTEIESHLGACDACCESVDRRATLKSGLRGLAVEHSVDDALRGQLDLLITTSVGARHTAARRVPRLAAAAVLCAGIVGTVAMALRAPGEASTVGAPVPAVEVSRVDSQVVDESVRWHSRPLPVEVTGPDQLAVSEWFRGKVDFVVSPPDFARRAHLLGGRLGNVRDHEAAFLVYDVGGTKLSVMVFDADGTRLPTAHTPTGLEVPFLVGERNGFNVAYHQHDGVAYTFTTDLPDNELRDLVNVAFSY